MPHYEPVDEIRDELCVSKSTRAFRLRHYMFLSSATKLYPSRDLSTVLRLYDELGPTPRLCLHFTDLEIQAFIKDRNAVVRSIEDFTSGKRLFDQLCTDAGSLKMDTMSHKICLIRRLSRHVNTVDFTINPMSDSVAKALTCRLEELNEAELLRMWGKFSQYGDARGMTGSIFEAYVHQQFRKLISFEASPMRRGTQANSRWYAPFSLDIPSSTTTSVRPIPSTTISEPKTVVYHKETLTIEADTYYIPRSSTQVALDSFIMHKGVLYIFQCTGGKNHKIKDGVVTFLESCQGLPSVNQWRFIFVVPNDLESFSCPASRNEVISQLNPYTFSISM